MKQRPILMSGPLVRETLAGNKTQTRRPVKFPEDYTGEINKVFDNSPDIFGLTGLKYPATDDVGSELFHRLHCEYGDPGDQLWVRETFFVYSDYDPNPDDFFKENPYLYRANFNEDDEQSFRDRGLKWKPSIFMPRIASRITLEIEEVRVERLYDGRGSPARRAEGGISLCDSPWQWHTGGVLPGGLD